MTVSSSRAALVTQQYSRRVADQPGAPGREATVVTAIADGAGADAYLARVAPNALAGLRRWRCTVFDAAFRFDVGETITLAGSDIGPAAGDHVVTGKDEDLAADRTILTLRGPYPEVA